jgi:hypothetical protein
MGTRAQGHSQPTFSRWSSLFVCFGALLLCSGAAAAPRPPVVGNISDAHPSQIEIKKKGSDGVPTPVKVGADVEEGAVVSIEDWCGSHASGYVKVNTKSGPVVLYCGITPHACTFTRDGVPVPRVGGRYNPPTVPTITSQLKGTVDQLRETNRRVAEARSRRDQSAGVQVSSVSDSASPTKSVTSQEQIPHATPSLQVATTAEVTRQAELEVWTHELRSARLCADLRHQRNMLYHAYGYCFKDPAVVAYFGNQGCTHVNEDDLPAPAQEPRRMITTAEAMYCK